MFSKTNRFLQMMAGAAMATACIASAQAPAPAATPAPAAAPAAADAPAAPTPLSTFVLTGPLSWVPPATFDAGPFGKLSVNGIITGFAQFQNNPVYGDQGSQATLTNGQIFIQKADGNFQWYVQAGAYALPTLSVPFTDAQHTVNNLYGPVPVAWAKINMGKTTSLQLGQLPTLMGAESTFSYQNFNIERGIVWNQETAVSRGLQLNQALGKYLSASLSWNDGYYSDRYSFLSGSIVFTKGPSVLVYDGMGNLGQTVFETAATPIQNNGAMHAVIYTYTKGPWIISPYFQYGTYGKNLKVGVGKSTSATGGAINVSYAFKDGFSIPIRFEDLSSSGTATDGSVNLLGFGPGSSAFTFTATPTYQKGGMFVRGDIGFVDTSSTTPGYVFGKTGTATSQFRGAVEFGFIFGDNIVKK